MQIYFNKINYKEVASKGRLIKMVQIICNMYSFYSKVDFSEGELESRALEHSLRSRDDIFVKAWEHDEMRMKRRFCRHAIFRA